MYPALPQHRRARACEASAELTHRATSSVRLLGKPKNLLNSTACHSSSTRLRALPTRPSTCGSKGEALGHKGESAAPAR